MGGTVNDFGRNNPVVNDLLLVIDVVQKEVQCSNALAETAFHMLPFGARNNPRDQIKREDAFGPL